MKRPATVIHCGHSPPLRATSSLVRRQSSVNSKVWKFCQNIIIPMSKQQSPTRVVRKAFFEAQVAQRWKKGVEGSWEKCPMSR